MTTYRIERRKRVLINTDPMRRCYDGTHARSEIVWEPWDWLELAVPEDRIEARMGFWRDLNDYAVGQRGEGARAQFRAIDNETNEELK